MPNLEPTTSSSSSPISDFLCPNYIPDLDIFHLGCTCPDSSHPDPLIQYEKRKNGYYRRRADHELSLLGLRYNTCTNLFGWLEPSE